MFCPGVLVLGPTLWNIFYDGLLKLSFTDGAALVCFADDVVLVVFSHSTEGIEAVANTSFESTENWISENRLALAHSKTEAVILTRKMGVPTTVHPLWRAEDRHQPSRNLSQR